MFLPQNIHKYTWTSPDGKSHNKIGNILIDGRWHSSILVRCFIAKVKERLAGNILEAQKFNVERFNRRKLNELEVKKQYQNNVSNRSAALENVNGSEDVNRAWESSKDDIETSALRV